MKIFFLTISVLLSSLPIIAQEKLSVEDIFYLEFYENEDGTYGFYETPSKLKGTELESYGTTMWAVNAYLSSEYTLFAEQEGNFRDRWEGKDTNAIKQAYLEILTADTAFERIFNKSYEQLPVPDIHIDSLQKIAARFMYLQMLNNGEIIAQFCTRANDAKQLNQTAASPYYNAFCYSVIRNLPEQNWDYVYELMILPSEIEEGTTEEQLESIKQKNYQAFEQSKEYRKFMLAEYEKVKPFLNFKIIL